jgi:hypothetical protein
MTNFYAIYLFIVVDIVLLGFGLYFKRGWTILLSAVGWLFTAVYCIGTGVTNGDTYVTAFGGFSIIASIASVIASMTANRKPKPVLPPEVNHSDTLANNAEKIRAARGKHKMKNQTGLFG